MKFAYADPPYIGCAKRYYKNHPDYAGEVDHKELLEKLYDEFPDGWALSASMSSLWDLIPMIPKDWKCRIAAWCKPFGAIGSFGRPQYCWEPVIFHGGRKKSIGTVADYLVANSYYARHGHKGTNDKTTPCTLFPGAKPDEFCYWIFELLNMKQGDEFVDLFPGTGRVMRAWERYQQSNMRLFVG